MNPPIRFATTRDGVRIAYCIHGTGPPLVFVRGWLTHLEGLWEDPAFRTYIESLAREMSVIRYDSRGQGLSDRDVPEIDHDALVRDLEAVMDELDIEKAVVYGVAFGGPIAISYAARHPERVRKLILDSSYVRGSELASPDQQQKLVESLRTYWPEVLPILVHFTNPDPRQNPWRTPQWAARAVSGETAAHLYDLGFRTDVSAELPSVSAPTLVVHPRTSRSFPAHFGREAAALIPDASFVLLEGSAQGAWDTDPDAALRAIGSFLGADLRVRALSVPVTGGPMAIVFTDIEGSTSLTQRLGDERAQEVIRTHNRIVRDGLAESGGSEIAHTGDGIMAAFPSVARSVECAVGIQRAFAAARWDTPVGVRIGINAGEPVHEEDDLFGSAVQAAARIAAKAQAGQILVSEVVRQLAAGKGFMFTDRGRVALRGFPERFRVYEVEWQAGAPA
jgi:class 3 adenylate cyclase/alpha-beta hydrolase superfamily lysophospholipase